MPGSIIRIRVILSMRFLVIGTPGGWGQGFVLGEFAITYAYLYIFISFAERDLVLNCLSQAFILLQVTIRARGH